MDYLIFNELSYPFKDRYAAISGVRIFLKTFAVARSIGLTQLRLHENIGDNLYNLELAPGYTFSQWLHSPADEKIIPGESTKNSEKNSDFKELFMEILTSTPFITDHEPIEQEEYERSSFKISLHNQETKEAAGLGAAFLLDTIAISFPSDPFWNTHLIKNLTHYIIKEDGNDSNSLVQVRHVSEAEHVKKHAQWFEHQKLKTLHTARDLWERREEFFPHLVLCGEVKQQLITANAIGSKYFQQVIDRLKHLDTYAKNWKTGGFSEIELRKEYGLTVTGESVQTMAQYGRERRFRLPNRRKEFFEKHIKTGGLRFHIFPDEENHCIYVGYIGKHLNTVTN